MTGSAMDGDAGLLADIPVEIGRASLRWVVGLGLVGFAHYGMGAGAVAVRTLEGLTYAQRDAFWRLAEEAVVCGEEARVTATDAPGAPLTLDLAGRRLVVGADGVVVDAGPAAVSEHER